VVKSVASNGHLLMHVNDEERITLNIFLGSECSQLRFTWEPRDRASIAERVRFLEFLGDAAGSLPPIEGGLASFGSALRTNLKDFAKSPFARARARARGRGEQRTGRLLSSSTAWGRMKTSKASWQLKVCHFSLLLRTYASSCLPRARYLPRTPCTSFFLRPLHTTSSAFFVFPPRAAGDPILARGRSAKCSVGKMDKDQANWEGNGRDCASERKREGRRNPTGWNNRLRLRAH